MLIIKEVDICSINFLGLAYYTKGRKLEATKDYNIAVDVNASFTDPHLNRGCLF